MFEKENLIHKHSRKNPEVIVCTESLMPSLEFKVWSILVYFYKSEIVPHL